MAYQKNINNDNRRSFSKNKRRYNDEEETFSIIGFKFKNKSFARPIIMTGSMASKYFNDIWRKFTN